MTLKLNRWSLGWWAFHGALLLADKLDNIIKTGCRDQSRRPQITEVKSRRELEPQSSSHPVAQALDSSFGRRFEQALDCSDFIFLVSEHRNRSDVCPLLIVSQGTRVDKRDHGGVWRLPVFPACHRLHSEDRTRLAVQLPHPERPQCHKVGYTLPRCSDTSTRVQNNSWKPLGNEMTSNKQRVCVSFSCDQAQNKQWAAPLRGGRFYNSLHKAEVSGPFSKFQSCVKPNRVSLFHQWRFRLFMLISTSPLCLRPTRRQRGSTSSSGSSSERCSSSRGVRTPGRRW